MPRLSPTELAARRHGLDTYIKSIVARADELTPDDLEKLRGLLPPADEAAEE